MSSNLTFVSFDKLRMRIDQESISESNITALPLLVR